jgi:predicted MFS family arabinose efflux permease
MPAVSALGNQRPLGYRQRMNEHRTGYSRYVLVVLLFGYALNSFDRSILSLLLEPIRQEFGVSDSQLGLLSGLAFAAFYSTLAIPIAVLADRWHRRNVLVLSVLIWTLMTALCGWAGSFAALLLARIGVGIGEAGANPSSHSLIAEYFPPERRATALGIYALGAPAGAMLAGLAGGWGSENLGWRGTMMLAGAPGLLLVPLLLLTVAEPAKRAREITERPDMVPLREVLQFLWSRPSFRHLCLACSLHSVAMYGASSFIPAYLSRSHGWSGGEVGQLVAMIGMAGLAGTFLGGVLSDRLGTRHREPRWQLWLPGIATLAVTPLQLVCYLGDGAAMTTAFLLSGFLSLVFFGPSFATVQALAASRMRAVAAAVLLFSKAIIGMGTGPLLVGFASDLLAPVAQSHSLRLALLLVPLFNVWAGVHFFRAAQYFRDDLARGATAPPLPAPAAGPVSLSRSRAG